jgi:hypothetical protein
MRNANRSHSVGSLANTNEDTTDSNDENAHNIASQSHNTMTYRFAHKLLPTYFIKPIRRRRIKNRPTTSAGSQKSGDSGVVMVVPVHN